MRTLVLVLLLGLGSTSIAHGKSPLFPNSKIAWGQTIEDFKAKNPKDFDPGEVAPGIMLTLSQETFSGRTMEVSHVFIDGKLAMVMHKYRYPLDAKTFTIADDFAQAKNELRAHWGNPDVDKATFDREDARKAPATEWNKLVMNGALKLVASWNKHASTATLEASHANLMKPGLLKVVYIGSTSPDVTVEDIVRRALR